MEENSLNHKMRGSITTVLPVKNEAKNLSKCLDRVSSLGPMVVVDSNSIDDTGRIANEAGATVLNFD